MKTNTFIKHFKITSTWAERENEKITQSINEKQKGVKLVQISCDSQ